MTATQDKKPTSIAAWKKEAFRTVELPSGNVMKIRKIGMQALLAAGTIPNSLMGLMQSALSKGKGVEDKVMGKLAEDPKGLADMVLMVNRIVTTIAYEPEVHMPPKSGEPRDENLLYADEIEEIDKMFLFGLISGGTRDLETFRKQHTADLESIQKLTGIPLSSK